MRTLHYLGPEGTFTHQAAVEAAESLKPLTDGIVTAAEPDIPSILDAVQNDGDWGVIAWENNIEGYVVPNLDALIDSRNVAGFARVGVNVSFDAFIRLPQGKRSAADIAAALANCTTIAAHPHGLAQCRRFTAEHRLREDPAASNGAACRDLRPGQVALGPGICGELYDLTCVGTAVEDYPGARTEFVVIAPRDEVVGLLRRLPQLAGSRTVCRPDDTTAGEPNAEDFDFESIIAFIPLTTGPGVLANLLDVLRDAGLNMTSFISRPIKGHDGTYSFIATIDAAPWQQHLREVLVEVAEHGDWVKTLAVYPRRERPNPPVDAWMLPEGGVHLGSSDMLSSDWRDAGAVGKELLW